jgi:hypothetical protein
MQYTIRNISDAIDEAARARAEAERESLNTVLLHALERGLGLESLPEKKRDLSFFAEGPPLEPEVLRALEEQRQIDPELWR